MNTEWTWYSKVWITVSVSATTYLALPELAGCPYFRSPSVAKENIWLIQAGYLVCDPTNSVKARRETQSRYSITQGKSTNDKGRRRLWVKSSERRKHADIERVLRSILAALVSTSGNDWLLNPLVNVVMYSNGPSWVTCYVWHKAPGPLPRHGTKATTCTDSSDLLFIIWQKYAS